MEENLRLVKEIKKILGDRGLRDLDFNVPKGKAAIILNIAEEEMPSGSDINKRGDIELQEIVENASKTLKISTSKSRKNPPRICLCENS